jgi:hypothetical protein
MLSVVRRHFAKRLGKPQCPAELLLFAKPNPRAANPSNSSFFSMLHLALDHARHKMDTEFTLGA